MIKGPDFQDTHSVPTPAKRPAKEYYWHDRETHERELLQAADAVLKRAKAPTHPDSLRMAHERFENEAMRYVAARARTEADYRAELMSMLDAEADGGDGRSDAAESHGNRTEKAAPKRHGDSR